MSNSWSKFKTWIYTKKMIILIIAIILFFPVLQLVIYPIIGPLKSIIIYFLYLIIIAILIRVFIKEN